MANSQWLLDMQRHRLVHISAWLGTIAALLGVFAMYQRPDFLVLLANQVWACF